MDTRFKHDREGLKKKRRKEEQSRNNDNFAKEIYIIASVKCFGNDVSVT